MFDGGEDGGVVILVELLVSRHQGKKSWVRMEIRGGFLNTSMSTFVFARVLPSGGIMPNDFQQNLGERLPPPPLGSILFNPALE